MSKLRISIWCFGLLFASVLCSGFDHSAHKAKISQDSIGSGGYLFAHMTTEEYGRLFYSLSRDGLNWNLLNNGNKINAAYRGHPDICKGGDGSYYMIGIEEGSYKPILWRSDSLIVWEKEKYLPGEVFLDRTPGYQANPLWYGAPKIYFDEASSQYMITWHAPETGIEGGNEWWESMRTFYILTPDFNSFTQARRLFDFTDESDKNMASIDVIIRKSGGLYYAVIKDERWPETSETGKTIRISTSETLTGPYTDPGLPVTPSWHEAPTIVPKLHSPGWYLYAESYPHRYVLFEADSLSGSWTSVPCNLDKVRHGCIVRIDEAEFNLIESSYYNAQPNVEIRTPGNSPVLYTHAGNIVELGVADPDGIIESAALYVDGRWVPEMEGRTNHFDIDFLEAGPHTLNAKVRDDRGGVATDTLEIVVADSLYTAEDWTLYQKNGALARLSIKQDTLSVHVERALGNFSDIMLLKELDLTDVKNNSSGQVSFSAFSNRYTALQLGVKMEPYSENTLLSNTFYISPRYDSYVLSEVPFSDSQNFLAFNLGYRHETRIHIYDLRLDFLNSRHAGFAAQKATVYPNPVSEVLYFSRETDYWIHSPAGSLMLRGQKATESNLSALPEGIYLVKTEYGNYTISKYN